MHKLCIPLLLALTVACNSQKAAEEEINDSTTPLHLLTPDYTMPYAVVSTDDVKATADRIFAYIDSVTPALTDSGRIHQGTFRLTSYEWAVVYDALLDLSQATSDTRYAEYVSNRIRFLATEAAKFKGDTLADGQMRQVLKPLTLDDAGAMVGAWMRASMADSTLRTTASPVIERYWQVVETSPRKLADGTIARNRPHYNAVWLDDMFMALPSMVQRSAYTADSKHTDEAIRIADGFISRMWMPEKQLFRHGYLEGHTSQPQMAWGRANGWAILTLCQLIDALEPTSKQRSALLDIYRRHVAALAALQGTDGLWHQLLDRADTYGETSATAIFTYAIAHGINNGWIEAETYGPVAMLGWNAASAKVDGRGRVTGTCVGTGMGFEPAYYAARPRSDKAAHGYGPMLWAAAEMITLLQNAHPYLNDSAVHFYTTDPEATTPLFSLDANGKAKETLH